MDLFLQSFLILICFHFLMDYPLQGEFISKFKSRHVYRGEKNPFWIHCLTAHSAIHSLPYLLLFGNVGAALVMFVSHWIIDLLKCENFTNIHIDQCLHLIIIFVLCIVYDFQLPWM